MSSDGELEGEAPFSQEVDSGALDELVQVVDRLLGPGGCPWDREQTHHSLKKYLLEECYEVLDAIDSGDPEKLKEELGDLLLQPIMHAQMEKAAGRFSTEEVARTIIDKLVRRHPHVFGPLSVENANEVLRNWDRIKQDERRAVDVQPGGRASVPDGSEPSANPSILEGVPKGLPALHRAYEVSKRAARVGFEWPNIDAVFAKLDEEIAELKEAILAKESASSVTEEPAPLVGQGSASPVVGIGVNLDTASPLVGEAGERCEPGEGNAAQRDIESEIGDLLFTVVNIARWRKAEPEEALRQMVLRFEGRFRTMESAAKKPLSELSPHEWDRLWESAKGVE